MMKFKVNGQTIERVDTFGVVESSENFLKAEFTFSEEWNGLIKTAAFIMSDGTVEPSLISLDGICAVPDKWLSKPLGYVGVLGSDGSTKITTNTTIIMIGRTGFTGRELEEDARTYFDRIMEEFANTRDYVKQAKRWAVGDEESEESLTDNAKYYCEKSGETLKEVEGSVEEGKKHIDSYIKEKEHDLKGETGDVNFCAFGVDNEGVLTMYQNKDPDTFSFRIDENDELEFSLNE